MFERLISVGRCTKVTKGGRNFSFSVIMVIGNKKGKVGYGLGKAMEIVDAREKAVYMAKKTMYKIPLKQNRTIYHKVVGEFCSSKVIIMPASIGRGIVAGGAIRIIFDVLGIQDIVAKSLKSNNPHNTIKATINGLLQIQSPRYIMKKRNKNFKT